MSGYKKTVGNNCEKKKIVKKVFLSFMINVAFKVLLKNVLDVVYSMQVTIFTTGYERLEGAVLLKNFYHKV